MCRHLLGEELKLPSAATWWCGQDSARQYVVENLDRLVVKPAFRLRLADSGKALSESEREALRRRIEFDPDLYVAQERVEWSTAPSWDGSGLTARPVGLRVFLVSSGGGYSVMPRADPGFARHRRFHLCTRRQQQGHLDPVRDARRGNHPAVHSQSERGPAPHGQ